MSIIGSSTLLEIAGPTGILCMSHSKRPSASTMFLAKKLHGDRAHADKIGEVGTLLLFTENTAYNSISPYSASKAASDLARMRTHDLHVMVTHRQRIFFIGQTFQYMAAVKRYMRKKSAKNLASYCGKIFESGFRKTGQWYLNNSDWVSNTKSEAYHSRIEQNYSERNQ